MTVGSCRLPESRQLLTYRGQAVNPDAVKNEVTGGSCRLPESWQLLTYRAQAVNPVAVKNEVAVAAAVYLRAGSC
jgi:hypothetical protein